MGKMIAINADEFFEDIKKRANMPLSTICKLMNISESTLSNSKIRGNLNLDTYTRLCDAFQLKREEYIADSNDKTASTKKIEADSTELKEIKELVSKHYESTNLLLTEIYKVLKELTYGTKE